MGIGSRFYPPNLYKDSVSLMTVSARVTSIPPGIEAASVVMASPTNVDNLAQAGLGQFEVRPNDLIVAVSGSQEACDEALAVADKLLSASPGDGGEETAAAPITSIQMAVAKDPALNLALISVPGDYAAAEAMKALRLGLDVMVFSDNVSPDAELALKEYARETDLMVMGPDCGTAIVNGIPLGFANVVRRGPPIGVVGASGTGTQEVTVRIHQNGSGGIARAGHRRPRLGRRDRRHLDAARSGRSRQRSGHHGDRAGVQAAVAHGGRESPCRGPGQRQTRRRHLLGRRSRRHHPRRRVRRGYAGPGGGYGRGTCSRPAAEHPPRLHRLTRNGQCPH